MSGRKRTETEREQDLVIVSRARLNGHNLREIANMISERRSYSLSHVTIKNDMDEVHKRWAEASYENTEELIIASLAVFAKIKREAWAAYERSKGGLIVKREERKAYKTAEDGGAAPISVEEIMKVGTEKIAKRKKGLDFTLMEQFENIEITQQVQETSRDGDPRWLEIIRKTTIDELKLLGAYDVKRQVKQIDIVVIPPVAVDMEKYKHL